MPGITHSLVSGKADGGDATLVRPSDWNAVHVGPTGRTVAYFVAANDATAIEKAQADYLCDGTNDHVEIQAAIDALPSTGAEVGLSSGTFNCQVTINLDTNQILRGSGWNTILTTSTSGLIFLSAVGGSGTEKTGIVIADLQIDGGASNLGDRGIRFQYVDYSLIRNVYSRRHHAGSKYAGIYLYYSDFNTITDNTVQANYLGMYIEYSNSNNITRNIMQGNTYYGIRMEYSSYDIISDNLMAGNGYSGTYLASNSYINCSNNICAQNVEDGIYINVGSSHTVTGNSCIGNTRFGLCLENLSYSSVTANTCIANGQHGLYIEGTACTLTNNTCVANSQASTNGYDDIYIESLGYNNVQSNTCRAGTLTNKPRYGISIAALLSTTGNLVSNNDLYDDGFGTASFYDAGTLTNISDTNRGIQITQVKEYRYVKNTSGGSLAAGDVVVLKAVAAGNEVTTTTTEGDQKVFGMAAETIADTAWGNVQVLGKTTALKVDGTTDIAIGDLIGTFTTAKIGMKAASGKMAFAIALEAYATNDSSGVIDALLISPRQAV